MMALIPEEDLLTRLKRTKRNGALHREAAAEIERLRERIENDGHLIEGVRASTIEECARAALDAFVVAAEDGLDPVVTTQNVLAAIRALAKEQK